MKKLLLAFAVAGFTAGFNYSEAKNLTINNQEYQVDTMVVKHRVGPGTTYAYYRLPGRPLEIHVLEIDRTNPSINLEVWNGGSAAVATETPSHVGQRYTDNGVDVVAVHNGDFYTTNLGEVGISRMGLIGAGECIFNPTGNPLFCLDENGTPRIDYVNFSGSARRPDGTEARIHTVNQLRLEWEPATHSDQLSLYTPAFGSKMHINSAGGTVVILQSAGDNTYPVNKPLEMEVVSVSENPGTPEIPENGSILHGLGSSATFLNALKAGDKVTLTLGAVMPSYPDVKTINDAIGGSGHIILRNGQVTNINNPECHPRTFMGISQDGNTIYSVIVDGRYSGSAGIDLDDQGRLLAWLGAWDGINLDGGGSSCMVVNGKIRNHNSDGTERSVGNGVIVYSSAPSDPVISSIDIEPGDWRLPAGAKVTPRIFGFNKYDYMVDDNVKEFTLTCDPQIGYISEDGRTFTASNAPCSGELTATSADGLKSTVTVNVSVQNTTSDLNSYIVDNRNDYNVRLTAYSGAQSYAINPASIKWTVTDPEIAAINNGKIRGTKNGSTTIIGTADHFTGEITVTTEIPDGDTRSVFEGIGANDIALAQSGAKNLTIVPDGNGFDLNYTGTGTSRGAYLQITGPASNWKTYGLPDAVKLTINPGKAPVKGISMNYTDNMGNRGSLTFTIENVPADQTTTYVYDFNKLFDTKDNAYYPLIFSGLRLTMGTSAKDTEYTVQIPAFEFDYSGNTAVNEITVDTTAERPDSRTIYNINGTPSPTNPAPGLYIRADGSKFISK